MKKMNLDVPDGLNKETDQALMSLPPENANNDFAKSMRAFAESQADKLGLDPEKYNQIYAEKVSEQNAYMITYIEEMLGELEDDSEEAIKRYNEKVDHLLNELVTENEEEIEIFIE